MSVASADVMQVAAQNTPDVCNRLVQVRRDNRTGAERLLTGKGKAGQSKNVRFLFLGILS